jgi:multidrug resistance efflux pump
MMRRRRKGKIVKWVLLIFGVLGVIVLALALIQIDDIVMAQGIVEPGDKIYIDSPLSRVVHDIFAEPGDTVRAGQPVAQLYSGDLRGTVATSAQEIKRERANLEAAKASLTLLREKPTPEELKIAEARVEQARITITARQQDLKRAEALYQGQRIFSQEDYERAQTNSDLAHATLLVAAESLNLTRRGASPAEIQQAEAVVRQTEATLEKAQQQYEAAKEALELTTLRAPVDGIVARQDLFPGMQANQGGIVMIIAGAGKDPVIGAWMPETSAWKVQPGQTVEILSNLFTDREGFAGEGEVSEVHGYAVHEGTIRTFGLEVAVRKTPIPLTFGSTADLRIFVGRRSVLQTLLGLENNEIIQARQNDENDFPQTSRTNLLKTLPAALDAAHVPKLQVDSLDTKSTPADTLDQ